ncbi:glycosyltransferase family 2 protein [Roseateles sp.]|uniref:glycosyltransferase family 2 protein n=1 Tax=Roseateles sp. TaxID=1971397 RepID=UPI003BA6EF83
MSVDNLPGAKANKPIFSLILATYGRVDEIGRLLDSLQAQTCQDFELIVVDQNPDERVLPFVQRAQAVGWSVQHLRLDRPNLSAARNAGMAVARGEWLAFPDDDCWYEPDTLAEVKAAALTRAGALDGLVINWVEQTHKTDPAQDSPLRLAAWRAFRGSDASSITLFIRAAVARDAGGFDERFGVGQWFGAGEETDFLLTLLARCARIERQPAARVHHAFGPRKAASLKGEWRFSLQRSRSWGALCRKHRLSAPVVLRGLVGPIGWLFLRPKGLVGLVQSVAATLGRMQGLVYWKDDR